MTVTLTVEQLEEIIRKVVREELRAFATQDFFDLDCSIGEDRNVYSKRSKIKRKAPEGR